MIVHGLGIQESWIQGKVIAARISKKGWEVHLDYDRVLLGRKLVIAIGIGEQPYWPDWAREFQDKQKNSIFIFLIMICLPFPK
ncbi:hypothetical protein [Bacillus sp. V5-8f]|uniref:hypothetical protein n=1 Tax=Bacillus sp. V5-8f TaxID=2053044 RepID=UPI000C77ABD6|nr:hypothetical protein [Bacillus sp. V5-8f]PLT33188.1 hypothetical protein CUU64_15545 [Bacillus sp. V5-8f]